MSSPGSSASAILPTLDAPDLGAEQARRHCDILDELIEMGVDLARHIHHQVTAPAEPRVESAPAEPGARTPLPDLVVAFDRINRAVRRAVLLARHIAEPPSSARITPGPDRVTARKRIIREVEDAIQREPRNTEALHNEFLDRLDSPDLEEEIATRPINDVILDIRRDLGLENMLGNHPWERRTPRDIEALRLRAAAAKPETPYTPAEHPPDISRPPNPNRGADSTDPAQELREMYALARQLSRL